MLCSIPTLADLTLAIPQDPANLTSIVNQTLAGYLADQTLSAVVCYAPYNGGCCPAICANTDLAGIGVRVAFYAQSAMNTLLVVVSPRDSVPSAWAGTLLTAGLIIAAIVQKAQGSLSLHHATLIMNFATLSCISSLAVAPLLPVWRLKPSEYYAKELERHALTDLNGEDHENILSSEVYINRHKKKIKAAQNRERVILALALLTQVVLQWAWGIILFVSPVYNQPECSGDTVLMLFFVRFTVGTIKGARFAVWPMWLLFCLGITLGLTIMLSLSSPNRAHDSISRRSTLSTTSGNSSSTPVFVQLIRMPLTAVPSWKDRTKLILFFGNAASFALWTLYIFGEFLRQCLLSVPSSCFYHTASEHQQLLNRIFKGENNFGGFGQITAILLSLQPVWSLVVALYKYPSLKRHQERSRQRLAAQKRDQSPSPAGNSPERRGLLTLSPQHSPSHSRDLSGVTATAPEEIEMGHIGGYADPDSRAQRAESRVDAGDARLARHLSQRSIGLNGVTIPTSDIGLVSDGDWLTQLRHRGVL